MHEESKIESQESNQKEAFKSELVIEDDNNDKVNEEQSPSNSLDLCCESLASSIQDSSNTSTCTSFGGHNR